MKNVTIYSCSKGFETQELINIVKEDCNTTFDEFPFAYTHEDEVYEQAKDCVESFDGDETILTLQRVVISAYRLLHTIGLIDNLKIIYFIKEGDEIKRIVNDMGREETKKHKPNKKTNSTMNWNQAIRKLFNDEENNS